jgi:4-amino-4-deoxy-L-arabinose transferase-like glycosyltransferase
MQGLDLEVRGKTARWGGAAWAVLCLCVAFGLVFRLKGLGVEGFGDDEVHKWLAANRYLHGDFGGDDVEHPMLMKSLIAGSIWAFSRLGFSPEALTRLPNVLAGGVSILVMAMLGRRLFGRTAGLLAAGLGAVSTTFVGYQRVAKEDTLLGLFLMLMLWCFAEAKAAADDAAAGEVSRAVDKRRWEIGAAASLAAMLASKYFFFFAPIPVVLYFWIRSDTRWRLPWRRWFELGGVAFCIWVCLNWSPFLPSTWEYAKTYLTGQQTIHGSLYFMGHIYHNLVLWGFKGTPAWFYFVFTAVKLAPATVAFAAAGLTLALVQRKPAHKILLSWVGVWFLLLSICGSKWGRFYVSVLPSFLLFAAYAGALLLEKARALKPFAQLPALQAAAVLAVALLLPGAEALAAVQHAPHYRLYISPLGGGDEKVSWYFPHCDYFDTGFREAVRYVFARAEPNAELSTEIDWPARLYSHAAGRDDLLQTLVRRGQTCRSGRVCYVVVQTGRLYFVNQDAVVNLARREPWHVEKVNGDEVVKVYKLLPGESPFPEGGELVQH